MGIVKAMSRFLVGVAAGLSGRRRATTVEAKVRAGKGAYDDLFAAEELRQDLVGKGTGLWSLSAGASSQLVATWCAFALHTLGERLIESEYAARPRLAGYLPAMTIEQATVFVDAGLAWSALARRALADPAYDVAKEVALPARLPLWRRMEPCPQSHVEAMLAAARALRDRAEVALADFSATAVPPEHAGAGERFRGLYAHADAAVGQAEHMWRPSTYQPLHRAVEDTLRSAVDQLFRLGQLLARPALLDRVGSTRVRGLPGDPGFDPWCLSDPVAARSLGGDPAARSALDHLWRNDPDPEATLALYDEVAQRATDGDVGPTGDKGSYYNCTPWPTIYTVRRPVAIAGHDLLPGETFTLDVCTGVQEGGLGFHRDLLVRDFHPTSRLRYCDQMDSRRERGSC